MKFLSSKALITIWSAVLQWARVGMNAIVFLILSRWLSLSEIGAVAAVQAPIIILQTLGTTMFPDFVVQEKKLNNKRLSSIFWLSVIVGLCLSLLLLAVSPLIVATIDDEHVQAYLFALAICPFAWCLASVFEGLHRKNLDTKRLAIRTLISSTIAGTIAITAGYLGYGGWAIVFFMLINTLISVFITIYSCDWRPSFVYSRFYIRVSRSRMLALSGRNFLAASVMPLLQFTISWQLGTASGGIFQIASRLYTLVDSIVMTPYRFVLMPMFARAKKTPSEFATYTTQAVSLGSLIASPAYLGLATIAPALLPFILGEKNGLACITTVQILCFNGVFVSLSNVVNQVLTARGYAVVVLRRSMLMYMFAVLPALLATLHSLELTIMTYSFVGGISGFILTLSFAKKYLAIDIRQMALSWFRPFGAGTFLLLLYGVYYLLNQYSYLLQIVLVLFLAIPVYIAALWLVAKKDLQVFINVIKRR